MAIEQSLNKFKRKLESDQLSEPRAKFNEVKTRIMDLKKQINQYQINIQRTQLENENLKEKLNKIQNASRSNSTVEDDPDDDNPRDMSSSTAANTITPAKILKVESQFNHLHSKIMKLQKEIIDKETQIAKHQFQEDMLNQLERKLEREKSTVERLETELLELSQIKQTKQANLEKVRLTYH